MQLWFYVIVASLMSLTACSGSTEQGLFVEYNVGLLSVTMDSNGSISFGVSTEFTIPSLVGSFTVGYYVDPARELNLPSALVIRTPTRDYVYDLHGQDFEIEFDSGYYERIRLVKSENNIILIVEQIDGQLNFSTSTSSQTSIRGFTCNGAYGPHFNIGDRFYVPPGDGSTSVWEEPNNVPRIGRIPENAGGVIIGGPVCKRGQEGNLVSWMVQTDSGLEGWVSEGYPHSPVPWIAPID